MRITIAAETFLRLSEVSKIANRPEFPWLRSVAFHRSNGKLVALASNSFFCAVEYLGQAEGPELLLLVAIPETLLSQCAIEKQFNSLLTIDYHAEHKFISVQTTFGYTEPGNCGIFPIEQIPLGKWRDWLPDTMPKKSTGCAFTQIDGLTALARSSPSGLIVWPKYIDIDKAIPLRDITSDNWLGIFYPKTRNETELTFDKLPDWIDAQ